MQVAMPRTQIRALKEQAHELARNLSGSEVGSVLFFLALIFVTFLV